MRINGKKINVESLFIISIIFCLALENFKLFDVLGASIKPIHLIAILAFLYCAAFRAITVKKIVLTVLFWAIPLCPLYRINDKLEFFKTYVIYVIMVVFIVFVLPHLKKTFCENPEMYLKLFNIVIFVLAILGIAQFITMNFMGFDFLKGIFGPFLAVAQATDSQGSGFQRAISLFSEPSYFGWVLDIALAVNLVMLKKRKSIKRILLIATIIVAIFATMSSSAFWITAVILLVHFISIKKINVNMIFIALAGVVVVGFVVAIFDFSFLTKSMSRLFTEMGVEGTSGNGRLVYPVEYVGAVLKEFPFFGRGMGQEGDADIISRIVGRETNVHNSIFGVVGTFGLTAVFYIVWIIKQFFGSRYTKESRSDRILIFISITFMYLTTGAFLAFDTLVFTIVAILILSSMETKQIENAERIEKQSENISNCSNL